MLRGTPSALEYGMAKMKDIISKAVNETVTKSKKPIKKKIYSLNGQKQKAAGTALKVLGALNALNKVLSSITSYARKAVFENILPEWLNDVVKHHRTPNSFTVTTDEAKALIVPMKKYAIINEARMHEILNLKQKYGIEIDVEEIRHFEFNQRLVSLIPEDKMEEVIDEIKKVLLKSTAVPAQVKKDIRSGRVPIIEEQSEYRYTEDILTNLPKLSEGDPKKAEAIINAVEPVFSLRSFEMENREVHVEEALDVIKESIHDMPEIEE
jgi:hypothetical protein